MPLVNVYLSESSYVAKMQEIVPALKEFLAAELSGSDIKLSVDEISVRFVATVGGAMIGKVEFEIIAHSFAERIAMQDEICLKTMQFVKEKTSVNDVKVWLQLSELGHSW